MRVLKTVTILMAVLIVGGTALLGTVIVHRLSVPTPSAGITLHVPPGTRITGIAPAGTGLAVALTGGGPDRVLLLDPRTLKPTTQLTLAPTAAPTLAQAPGNP